MKVAQVGRRLAEMLLRQQPEIAAAAGLHPEVVEAASLAHDLGHAPFGHVGEDTLHDLVCHNGDKNGFEGNAQTFRIVTKLAVRFGNAPGLDLCRATLAACLKYPWLRDDSDEARTKKWGAYDIDEEDFTFARAMHADHSEKTIEAQLMDWADDIAYSVHDLEDFHRCGAIPWVRILKGDRTDMLVQRGVEVWFNRPTDAEGRLRRALVRLQDFFFTLGLFNAVLNESYEGTRDQRYQLRLLTSSLIGRYIKATSLVPANAGTGIRAAIVITQAQADEVKLLKQITRDYVIGSPSLIAQQRGQKQIITHLFNIFMEDVSCGRPKWLPRRLEYLWSAEISHARFTSDCIASLTEAEVVGLTHLIQRLEDRWAL